MILLIISFFSYDLYPNREYIKENMYRHILYVIIHIFTCFYMKRMVLQVESYEKYVLECEEKEKAEMLEQIDDEKKSLEMSEKWKERRECLDMLKRELERVREGKDMSDWDALLDEELKKHELEAKLLEEEEEEENLKNDSNKEKSDSEKEVKNDEIDTEPKKKK